MKMIHSISSSALVPTSASTLIGRVPPMLLQQCRSQNTQQEGAAINWLSPNVVFKGCRDGAVKIWDVRRGKEESTPDIQHPYAFKRLQTDYPGHDWDQTLVGTTEWWQGDRSPYVIVDHVRATNDKAALGFLLDHRRLNVLLSRQQQVFVINGDRGCVVPPVTGVPLRALVHFGRVSKTNPRLLRCTQLHRLSSQDHQLTVGR